MNILKKKAFWGVILIILLGTVLYSNTLNAPFHFDDIKNITENKALRNVSDIKNLWQASPLRFLSYYSFAINYAIGGYNVTGYHLVNIAIHILSAIIVYFIILNIFEIEGAISDRLKKWSYYIALFASLLFVSHPVATQAVTYIVQRMEELASLFYLLSFYLYIKGRVCYDSKAKKYIWYLLLSLSSFLLAVLSKEIALTLPLILLVFEIIFYRSFKAVYFILPFFVATVLIAPFLYSKTGSSQLLAETADVTKIQYFMTQINVYFIYFGLLFLPLKQNVDYSLPFINNISENGTLIKLLIISGIIGLSIYFAGKNKIISFGVLWFFIALSVTSSFFPIRDAIFEHRLYIALFGFCLFFSYLYFAIIEFFIDKGRFNNKFKFLIFPVLIILFFSGLTYMRNNIWNDDVKLWLDCVQKSPNNARGYNNLGAAYYLKDDYNNALLAFDKSISLNPEDPLTYYNVALLLSKCQRNEEAINLYLKSLSIDPQSAMVWTNIGNCYREKKDYETAIIYLKKAVLLDDKQVIPRSNLADCYWKTQKPLLALKEINEIIKIEPEMYLAYEGRGIIYFELGEYEKAENDFLYALKYDDNLGDTHLYLSKIYLINNKDLQKANYHQQKYLYLKNKK